MLQVCGNKREQHRSLLELSYEYMEADYITHSTFEYF